MTLLERLNREIEDEERRITEGIADALRLHTSMHNNYWEKLHSLRERRRTLIAVLEALAEP
jgi:predicted component of type VI protein secretion system